MKWYHLFFMCSALLSPCAFMFGMEEGATASETPSHTTILTVGDICTILKEEDNDGVLLRPDELIYTPTMFMERLKLTQSKLQELLGCYRSTVMRKIGIEIKFYAERQQQLSTPDFKKVLDFLHSKYAHAERTAPLEQFQHLKDQFWSLQRWISMDTGVDLSNEEFDLSKKFEAEKETSAISTDSAQEIKDRVQKRLGDLEKKRRFEKSLKFFEKQASKKQPCLYKKPE